MRPILVAATGQWAVHGLGPRIDTVRNRGHEHEEGFDERVGKAIVRTWQQNTCCSRRMADDPGVIICRLDGWCHGADLEALRSIIAAIHADHEMEKNHRL